MNSIDRKRSFAAVAFGMATLAWNTAYAGGISLYEVGTADVGLAAAGYSARAQDASTVFTNPAGMTRLAGDQLTLGAQLLYADLGFSIAQGTSPALGGNAGGNPIEWFPGGGMFYSHSVSADVKVGVAITGNFGSAVKYDSGWVGRYYIQEGTLLGMSILPSAAWRVDEHLSLGASLNVMYGKFDTKVGVNNIVGPDGSLSLDDNTWGLGANLGLLYEVNPGTRFGITYNSPVDLKFSATTQWDGLAPALRTVLGTRGLLDADVDLGVTVPQGVNASFYHAIDPRWAILGSVGWQQWSKFGHLDVGIDSNNPVSVTSALNYKDTWHIAGGAQYKLSDPWLLNAGIAYDSGFQDNDNVALALPANAAWRFGVGMQKTESKTFNWGWSAEYIYGADLHTNVANRVPVAIGGRGDVVGSFNNVGMFFVATNFNWKF